MLRGSPAVFQFDLRKISRHSSMYRPSSQHLVRVHHKIAHPYYRVIMPNQYNHVTHIWNSTKTDLLQSELAQISVRGKVCLGPSWRWEKTIQAPHDEPFMVIHKKSKKDFISIDCLMTIQIQSGADYKYHKAEQILTYVFMKKNWVDIYRWCFNWSKDYWSAFMGCLYRCNSNQLVKFGNHLLNLF